ncbi:hypothetical protein GHT06_013780 [Daphnia sinensis]|uniref:Peptidase S1 domain-containing protein n=1 Tax=Daphnia sinensis TaxID=1820382 RepID=A0AAD5KSI1_9CRUS|nr:hypothetical protein GHT06_013780 [Daphnia sinensis]
MNYSVLLLAVIVCSVTAVPVALNGRIIEGGIAYEGQFPYVVSITENGRHFCGGFIYSEKWIVTAASCIVGKVASKLQVVVGQLELTAVDPNEEAIQVYQIYPFDGYDSVHQVHDVAMIQLTKNISFSNRYAVNFINYDEVDMTNPEATVMGWGASQEGGFESTRLHYASVTIRENEPSCGDYNGTEFQTASMLCAQSSSTSSNAGAPCQYDEGSPLVQLIANKPRAVGVMSKNTGCSMDLPSVYTRISIYYAWFSQLAGQQELDDTIVTTTVTPPTTVTESTAATTTTASTTTVPETTTSIVMTSDNKQTVILHAVCWSCLFVHFVLVA